MGKLFKDITSEDIENARMKPDHPDYEYAQKVLAEVEKIPFEDMFPHKFYPGHYQIIDRELRLCFEENPLTPINKAVEKCLHHLPEDTSPNAYLKLVQYTVEKWAERMGQAVTVQKNAA